MHRTPPAARSIHPLSTSEYPTSNVSLLVKRWRRSAFGVRRSEGREAWLQVELMAKPIRAIDRELAGDVGGAANDSADERSGGDVGNPETRSAR